MGLGWIFSFEVLRFLVLKFSQLGAEYKRKGFFHFGLFGCFRELGSWVLEAVKIMFYGAVSWDPWLIVVQIVCLQCLYYLTLGVFMAILVGTRVSRMSLVYFFDYAAITASTVTGWCVIASFVLGSLAGSVYLLYLVERAKKCLDFSASLYIIHLFICIMYGGWPSSITWWIVNGTGIAVMALLGEYLCVKFREMREIPITRPRSNNFIAQERTENCPREATYSQAPEPVVGYTDLNDRVIQGRIPKAREIHSQLHIKISFTHG